MASDKLFNINQEPQRVRDEYGPTQFGQQALVARRLVEAGVPFVRVARAWWDSHGQNFETHQELVPELRIRSKRGRSVSPWIDSVVWGLGLVFYEFSNKKPEPRGAFPDLVQTVFGVAGIAAKERRESVSM